MYTSIYLIYLCIYLFIYLSILKMFEPVLELRALPLLATLTLASVGLCRLSLCRLLHLQRLLQRMLFLLSDLDSLIFQLFEVVALALLFGKVLFQFLHCL